MTTEQMKQWIDSASYEALLSRWRFVRAGDPFFQGEVGNYYAKVMREKRAAVGDDAHVAASKRLG